METERYYRLRSVSLRVLGVVVVGVLVATVVWLIATNPAPSTSTSPDAATLAPNGAATSGTLPAPQVSSDGLAPEITPALTQEWQAAAHVVLRAFFVPPEPNVDLTTTLQPYATQTFTHWLKDQWVGAGEGVSFKTFNVSFPTACGPKPQGSGRVILTAYVEMEIKFGDEPIEIDNVTALVEFTSQDSRWRVSDIVEFSGFACESGE